VTSEEWPRIAVVGAGAVGCYFGGLLARAGAPVTLIGRAPHVTAINQSGLLLETLNFQERVPVAASREISAAGKASVVLLCVKTLDTESAAREAAPHLAGGAAVVSLQNGVDNVERIRAATGLDAIPAVVYVAAAMVAPGHVKHTGRGDLILGDLYAGERREDDRRRELLHLAAIFRRAAIPCRVSDNIHAELWIKLVINCAYNAVSALARARYGRIAADPLSREILRQVTEEAIAVAKAEGVCFPEDVDLFQAGMKLGNAMKDATSSTAQDIARGKRTEIDSLNGYVVRRGCDRHIPTPVNQTLHALVKLLEGSAAG
jgi:2-dehydropantoate 2-reductase